MSKSQILSLFLVIASSLASPYVVNAQTREAPPQSVIVASTRDPQWMSYRKAYSSLEWLEAYAKPKQFVRLPFELWPIDSNESTENLRLGLVGDQTHLVLPLDDGLNAIIPKLKQAYDEDAEFRINRKAGTYQFQNTGSIVLNQDGKYPLTDLRTACDQLLSVLRNGSVKYRLQFSGKKCSGVEFFFKKIQHLQ
ncbi:hypothetical protein [Undibacterium sp. Xuan67W]|uniref:hypothetical protein n=1 Tax=Undibacterium sp. Xuan67W TaxID=3413057 RepID=UPI003BF402BA